jgi:hypothetical protein
VGALRICSPNAACQESEQEPKGEDRCLMTADLRKGSAYSFSP